MKAKIFTNGRSQAVRLPLQFRFEGTEVYIRRDAKTGDVVLSTKPDDWSEYLIALQNLDPAEVKDFMQGRVDPPPPDRVSF